MHGARINCRIVSARACDGLFERARVMVSFPGSASDFLSYRFRTQESGTKIQGGPSASGKRYVDSKFEVAFCCKFIL